MSRLPIELMLQIIECLIPSGPPVAFPASHPITRTLLSFTLVCKAIHSTATQLLHIHCLYIDSDQRLVHLLAASPLYASSGKKDRDEFHAMTRPSKLDTAMGLYISPFPDDSIDKPQIVEQVHSLFLDISRNLTRLVIDMPLRSLYPADDHNHVRPTLHAAFASLTALEDFCSVRDELFCDTTEARTEPPVWASWPRLKRLALYNADVTSSSFLAGLRDCRALTHLVLTRPDGLEESIPDSECPPLPPLKRLMIVETGSTLPRISAENWRKCFVRRILVASQMPISARKRRDHENSLLVCTDLAVSGNREYDPITCQEWTKDHATDGTLWEFAGPPVLGTKS